MFSPDKKPRRIHMMSLGVLNLPRLPVLDWAFGHSLISCHVEHHLFPRLSDNMCLKVDEGGAGGAWMRELPEGGGGVPPSGPSDQLTWPEFPRRGLLREQAAVWLLIRNTWVSDPAV